jgi:hypothetical protein
MQSTPPYRNGLDLKTKQIREYLESLHGDIDEIMAEIQKKLQMLGVIELETNEKPDHFFLTQLLAHLPNKDAILGEISARFRGQLCPERVDDLFFDEAKTQLIRPIDESTPTDELLDLIARTDENSEKLPYIYQISRLVAQRQIIKRLITRDLGLQTLGAKIMKARHYLAILKSVPQELSEKGVVGGKSMGIMYAYAILEQNQPEFDAQFAKLHGLTVDELHQKIPLINSEHPEKAILQQNESIFIGSDLFLEIKRHNSGLTKKDKFCLANSTIYKYIYRDAPEQKVPDQPEIKTKTELFTDMKEAVKQAEFPPHLLGILLEMFKKLHGKPIIVRSSSRLEDKYGSAFAGKYKSVELANSGDFETDFQKFLDAIKNVFLSMFAPSAMEYRLQQGLTDEDEQMGFLVQIVNGKNQGLNGECFNPALAGVAMSYIPISFSTDLDCSRGGMRVVANSLGRLAVDNVGEGRVVWFSHPGKEPIPGRSYQNKMCTIPLTEDIKQQRMFQGELNQEEIRMGSSVRYARPYDFLQNKLYPSSEAPFIFSHNDQGYISPAYYNYQAPNIIVTFQGLVDKHSSNFPMIIEYIIKKLEYTLGYPVDIEFTAEYDQEKKQFKVKVVQCRPQNISDLLQPSNIPENIPTEQILMSTNQNLCSGYKKDIRYLIYLPPETYQKSCHQYQEIDGLTYEEMKEIRIWIKKINAKMKKFEYFTVALGRWGSECPNSGTPCIFGDYFNSAGFVELTGKGYNAEVSFGTHDFQNNVVEGGMSNLAVAIDEHANDHQTPAFNHKFFAKSQEYSLDLEEFLGEKIPPKIKHWLRLIDIEKAYPGCRMHIAQNNRTGKGAVYVAKKGQNYPILANKK